MGQTSIILGNNTLTGVETLKLTDATNTTAKVDFTYGATPSGTIDVKLGDTTLTGVNEISVLGTDSTYKSFGYAAQASGYSVSVANESEGQTGTCYYSLDDGVTWVDIGNSQEATIQLMNVTQIKFKLDWVDTYVGYAISNQLNLDIDAYQTQPTISQNYILTQNITDVRLGIIHD